MLRARTGMRPVQAFPPTEGKLEPIAKADEGLRAYYAKISERIWFEQWPKGVSRFSACEKPVRTFVKPNSENYCGVREGAGVPKQPNPNQQPRLNSPRAF